MAGRATPPAPYRCADARGSRSRHPASPRRGVRLRAVGEAAHQFSWRVESSEISAQPCCHYVRSSAIAAQIKRCEAILRSGPRMVPGIRGNNRGFEFAFRQGRRAPGIGNGLAAGTDSCSWPILRSPSGRAMLMRSGRRPPLAALLLRSRASPSGRRLRCGARCRRVRGAGCPYVRLTVLRRARRRLPAVRWNLRGVGRWRDLERWLRAVRPGLRGAGDRRDLGRRMLTVRQAARRRLPAVRRGMRGAGRWSDLGRWLGTVCRGLRGAGWRVRGARQWL